METHRTQTKKKDRKPWALIRPQISKTTNFPRQKSHQAAENQTTVGERHLVVTNKRLSVSTGKRSRVLSKLKRFKLRKRRTKALSKKVNKDATGLKSFQSKTTPPRAKNIKVPRTRLNSRNLRTTSNFKQAPGHNSVLHPPEQEQVVYRNNTPLKNPQRKNLNRFSPIGVYRVTNHQDRYLSHTNLRFKFSTKPEVNIGNEFLPAKETRLQDFIHLGPKSYEKMNSNFAIKETDEMPVQIFESDTETQEKDEAKKPAQEQGPAQSQEPAQVKENQKLEVQATVVPSNQDPPEERLKYFSCGKCGQGFKTPGEVESHWDKPCSPIHGPPGNFTYHHFTPRGTPPSRPPKNRRKYLLMPTPTATPTRNPRRPAPARVTRPPKK